LPGSPLRRSLAPLAPHPTPVFAAIAAHKAAYARLDQACLHVSRLEKTIPEEQA
jgi:hypothetical protein